MQRNEPRRSSRLAEQRLAAGATNTGGNSSGPKAVGTGSALASGTTAVAEAVAEAERRIAATTPSRKRGRPSRAEKDDDPVANAHVVASNGEDGTESVKDTDTESMKEAGEERRGKRNRSPSPSSVSDESSSDEGSDDPMLKSCWMYRTTKLHYREVLPVPFKVSNARIVKDARLWPLLWDTVRATEDSFTNVYDLDGDLTKAFESSLKLTYSNDFGEFNLGRHLPRLKSLWKLLGKVYLCSETPSEVLEGSSRVIWEDARKIVDQMDAEYLSRVLGHAAGDAYRHEKKLSADLFPKDSAKAVKAALKAGRGNRQQGPKSGHRPFPRGGKPARHSRTCAYCKMVLPRGETFQRHNRTCPNQ